MTRRQVLAELAGQSRGAARRLRPATVRNLRPRKTDRLKMLTGLRSAWRATGARSRGIDGVHGNRGIKESIRESLRYLAEISAPNH
jgi:hypothetical protein